MGFISLDALSNFIVQQSKAAGFVVHGPVETEYGWGWSETISFWNGNRRVHFYYNLHSVKDEKYGVNFQTDNDLTVEVAEIDGLDTPTRRGILSTLESAWQIVYSFLCQNMSVTELPDYQWKFDNLDHDKFIPHPPNADNPGNIAQVTAQMNKRWHPPKPNQ
jgi:hypothetical protein